MTKGDSGGDRTEKSGYRRKISKDRSETAVTGGRIVVIGHTMTGGGIAMTGVRQL